MRLTGYVAAIALLAVAPLAAQSQGTFEIGGFWLGTKSTHTHPTPVSGQTNTRATREA